MTLPYSFAASVLRGVVMALGFEEGDKTLQTLDAVSKLRYKLAVKISLPFRILSGGKMMGRKNYDLHPLKRLTAPFCLQGTPRFWFILEHFGHFKWLQ